MTTHKLLLRGKGENLIGECFCGWCWLGTYELPRNRRAKCHAAYDNHLERVAWAARLDTGTEAAIA